MALQPSAPNPLSQIDRRTARPRKLVYCKVPHGCWAGNGYSQTVSSLGTNRSRMFNRDYTLTKSGSSRAQPFLTRPQTGRLKPTSRGFQPLYNCELPEFERSHSRRTSRHRQRSLTGELGRATTHLPQAGDDPLPNQGQRPCG